MKKYLSVALVLSLLSVSSLAIAGDPVPGIDVKITNSESGTVTTTRTDATGKFSAALGEGKYTVCISQEACEHAINTKGTGSSGRSYSAGHFALEVKNMEGVDVTELIAVGDVKGPRDAASGQSAGKMDTRVITFSDKWTSSRAGLALSVSGKKKEFIGHVILMK